MDSEFGKDTGQEQEVAFVHAHEVEMTSSQGSEEPGGSQGVRDKVRFASFSSLETGKPVRKSLLEDKGNRKEAGAGSSG